MVYRFSRFIFMIYRFGRFSFMAGFHHQQLSTADEWNEVIEAPTVESLTVEQILGYISVGLRSCQRGLILYLVSKGTVRSKPVLTFCLQNEGDLKPEIFNENLSTLIYT